MKIIIYGSQYGTSRRYAEELAKRTGIEALSFEAVNDMDSYNTIVYIGSLYAGGILGMKKTFAKLSNYADKKIIIATVGLADPEEDENISNIRNSMKKQLSGAVFERANIFHLRGGIDYSVLNLKHKAMMGMLYKKVIKIPEEERTSEISALIDTYKKKVDFVDFNTLDKIEKAI